ncbi:beta propeller repeat protein [Aliiglaciecola aliphaticivorans]
MKKLILIFVISAFLNGCATYEINSTHLDNSQPLAQNHGVVALQVINNTARLAPLHPGWTEVIAIRMDNHEQIKQAAIEEAKAKAAAKNKAFNADEVEWDPEAYTFSPNSQGVVDSQLFAGSMPEGEYLIASLYSFYSDGNMSSWLTMPVYASAGTFNVKAGEFTNLGSLVFQPLLNIKETSFWSNRSSSKAYVTRISEAENLQDFIIEHFPNLASSVNFNQPLGWEDDKFVELRNKLSALSRNNAYGSQALILQEHNKRAVAAKFGQLHVVNNDDSWTQIDLPTNGQLTSVLELDGKILVGSERGQVFISDSLQGDWTATQPVSAAESIIWFGKAEETLFAATASAKSHFFYTINKDDLSWQRIGNFERKNPNDFWVQNGGLFPILTANGQLRVLNDNKLYDFTIESKQWTSVKSSPMVQVSQLANGVLVGLEVSQWDGVGDQAVSFDYGQNWTSLSRSLKTFGDNTTDRSLPIVLGDKTLITLGRVDKTVKQLQIISTTTNGEDVSRKDWIMRGTAKPDCEMALPKLTNGQRIYFLCDQGQIVSTDDFGQTWKTNVEMDIAAMQAEYESLLDALKQQDEKEPQEPEQ